MSSHHQKHKHKKKCSKKKCATKIICCPPPPSPLPPVAYLRALQEVLLLGPTTLTAFNPPLGTTLLLVELFGAGGGGGGAGSQLTPPPITESSAGAGGGGGGAVRTWITQLKGIFYTYTYTLAGGGVGGLNTGGNGANATTSDFTSVATGFIMTAQGGEGGLGMLATAVPAALEGARGGSSSSTFPGSILTRGGSGSNAMVIYPDPPRIVVAGAGGAGAFGGGETASKVNVSQVGTSSNISGSVFSVGGGGAICTADSVGFPGGNGAPAALHIVAFAA